MTYADNSRLRFGERDGRITKRTQCDHFSASEARQTLFSPVIRESVKPTHTIANILVRQAQESEVRARSLSG